jgi:hypothetical protein
MIAEPMLRAVLYVFMALLALLALWAVRKQFSG